jgi:hypothetical protein
MGRFAIKHEPSNRWVREDEGGVFLEEDDSYLMTYKNKKLAEGAIQYYKDYYTTQSDDRFLTEDGFYPFEEFIIVEV